MLQNKTLLDLFCKAGGASVGYHRSGFRRIVGVDHESQPRYPFEFVQDCALDFVEKYGRAFDCIHASPPCQKYSQANNIHGRTDHVDLIAPVRELLIRTGKPYVIENVPGAPLHFPVQICGLFLGLGVRRHRLFESNKFLFGTPCGNHRKDYVIVFGGGGRGRAHVSGKAKGGGPVIYRSTVPLDRCKEAMGIDWMTRDELSQAVPPAYTEHIGRQLMEILGNEADNPTP